MKYTWLCNGPRLEVLSTKSGAKVAAWTFGEVIKDYHTRITCVAEVPVGAPRSAMLAVGLQSAGTRGMLCVFDVRTSKVLRAVNIEKPVSTINIFQY